MEPDRVAATGDRAPAGGLAGVAFGLLLASSAVWVLLTSSERAAAVSVAALIVAFGTTVAVAALVARSVPRLVPSAIVAVAAIVAAGSWNHLADGSPRSAPLGYGNAAAALFALGVAAALLIVVASRRTEVRVVGWAAAAVLAAAVLATGCVAASLLLVLPLIATRIGGSAVRALVVAGCLAVAVALLATIAAGAGYRGDRTSGVQSLLARGLTERRLELWHDAVAIVEAHPLTGVGAGRFRDVSPTALGDADAAWAHEEFLQVGAEQGVIGAALLLGAVWAALWWMGSSPGAGHRAAIGVAALTSLAIHASVDYVLHFPVVVLCAGGLIGAAAARANPGLTEAPVGRPVDRSLGVEVRS
jgi:O-antigen ligase